MNEHETTYKVEYIVTTSLGQSYGNVLRGFETRLAAKQAVDRIVVHLGFDWSKIEFSVVPEQL